jgi:predicted  nucleic acid-binding Zn-ribbon protein
MNAQERATQDQDPVEDFHIVSQLSVQMEDMPNAVSVPLPMDLPPIPNLSNLPAHILHSGTVETLIGQNEDLMARLKVNIRRNSVLEQQIMEQDRLHARLKSEHASLIAQHQVLQEKSELLRDKTQTFDSQLEDLREQIEISQIRAESAEERSAELRAGLKFEQAYRRRVHVWVRPSIDALKNQLVDARSRISFLDRQLGTREAVIGDLRERLVQTEKAHHESVAKNNADQSLLIESYENRVRAAEGEMTKARAESSLLRDKASRLDEAVASLAQAENRIVSLERKNSDMERTLKEELKAIQEQLGQFRREAKELAAETLSATTERDRALASELVAKAELDRARDQFESLQAVWNETQRKFEASQLQQDSLNKLNQELSRQLKSERKARETSTVASVPEAVIPTANRLEKIDTILAELESGYSKARSLNVDFIDDDQETFQAVEASSRETSAREASL